MIFSSLFISADVEYTIKLMIWNYFNEMIVSLKKRLLNLSFPFNTTYMILINCKIITLRFNHMGTNDTIITTAKRVSENSALDSWLLIVCHSKSGVALKIMMVADNNIHFKIIIRINMYMCYLKQRYIEINRINTYTRLILPHVIKCLLGLLWKVE